MYNFLRKTKNQEISVVLLLYTIFLFIGLISFKDYGISVDEWELREHGFSYLIYICEIFFKETALNINNMETFKSRLEQHLWLLAESNMDTT